MIIIAIGFPICGDPVSEIESRDGFVFHFKIKKKDVSPDNLGKVLMKVREKLGWMPNDLDRVLIVKKGNIIQDFSRKEIEHYDAYVELGQS